MSHRIIPPFPELGWCSSCRRICHNCLEEINNGEGFLKIPCREFKDKKIMYVHIPSCEYYGYNSSAHYERNRRKGMVVE